jgi:hypothetical protein
MKRLLIGGIVGGLILFVWSAFSHMVLPIGAMGLRSLPNENVVMPVMKDAIREPGLYIFPGMDLTRTLTSEEQAAWQERYRAGPVGLLVYRPQGENPMSPRQLITDGYLPVWRWRKLSSLLKRQWLSYRGIVYDQKTFTRDDLRDESG